MKQKPFASIILIALGLFFLLTRLTGQEVLKQSFVLILGLGFLFYSFKTRQTSFFIPAGILIGIGTGLLFMALFENKLQGKSASGLFLLCFSAGWLSIPLLFYILKEKVWWPFIPAGIIGFVGLALVSGGLLEQILSYADYIWPVGLIALGLWLWFKPEKKDKSDTKDTDKN